MSDSKSRGGIGFFGALTLLFIGLKLMGYISWSWWLIFAPIYVPAILVSSLIVFLTYMEVRSKRPTQVRR